VPGTGFHDAAVVIGIGVNQRGLRTSSFEHFVQIRKEERVVEFISCRVVSCERLIWFSNANEFDLRTVERVVEKSLDVSVNQANDGDAQWRTFLARRILAWSK
jgi:hypothetical protein